MEEALELLAHEGAAVLAGGTDLAGQIDRGIRSPTLLVDLQGAGLGGIAADGDGVRIGATTTLSELAGSDLLAPYAAVATAAGLAASPLLRNQGTVGGNLCQHTRCWYYRGEEWTAGSAAATPATPRSATTASTTWRQGTASRRIPPIWRRRSPRVARPSSSARPRASGSCRCSSSTAGRPRTTARSSRSRWGRSSSRCGFPAPPEASAYLRTGERQAFSFPLVSVAAARTGGRVTLAAAGVANIPRSLDPADPLAGLPGHPQSAWKRTVLATLVERATAAL